MNEALLANKIFSIVSYTHCSAGKRINMIAELIKQDRAAVRDACAQRAEEVIWSLSPKDARENIKRAVIHSPPL